MHNRIIIFFRRTWDSTFLKKFRKYFKESLILIISVVCLLFGIRVVNYNDWPIYYKLTGAGVVLITMLIWTFILFKTILMKWIWNSFLIKKIRNHYSDFRYVWVILLALALGLLLLYPALDWQYSRSILVALVAYVLWIPLDAICGQTKTGKVIIVLFMLLLIILSLWFVPRSPLSWIYHQWWCRIMLIGLAALIILRPMNAVYGLMGTSGSIRLFFVNFVIISLIFSSIYYFGFFKDAGISYDVNQPHIDFQKYAATTKADTTKEDLPIVIVSTKRDTVYVEHKLDSKSYTETVIQTHVTRDTIMPPTPLQYQPIDFWQVWRSTILTTLTQESADLLSIATVHNEAMESTNVGLDKEKSELFEWILIFHIIISWIFFGVFISLLYNKFRYES